MTMKEVQLNYELMNNNVAVLDYATPPMYPIKPRKRVNLMIGAMFGMFLGLGVVFFLDYLDNTLGSALEVERLTDLPVLAVIPRHGPAVARLSRGRRRRALTAGQQGSAAPVH